MQHEWWVFACPLCGAEFRRLVALSGNSLMADLWTDGLCTGPMTPSAERPLERCPACREFVWCDDSDAIRHNGKREPTTVSLNADEILSAIESGIATDRRQELVLRQCVRWRLNDPMRDDDGFAASLAVFLLAIGVAIALVAGRYIWAGALAAPCLGLVGYLTRRGRAADLAAAEGAPPLAQSETARTNLSALATLLREDIEEERVLLAGVHRELADYERAAELLDYEFADEHRSMVEMLRELVRNRDARLQYSRTED